MKVSEFRVPACERAAAARRRAAGIDAAPPIAPPTLHHSTLNAQH